ncbi:MAG: hypothetical protein AAF517_12455, partial [Planctomycetota bacterium]
VVPARADSKDSPGYPEFLLYAGTGTPGVGEINAVSHGPAEIVVADEFGPLFVGSWSGPTGVSWTPAGRRIPWRSLERSFLLPKGKKATIRIDIRFPKILPAKDDDHDAADVIAAGVRQSATRLELKAKQKLVVYVYPDSGSIRSLTGKRVSGFAVPACRTLHVVRFENDGLKSLMAHEATHALSYYAWGTAGTPFLGEGLAVWVSGQYGGTKLSGWNERIPANSRPSIESLLGSAFRRLPENRSYPLGGLFVGTAVKAIGLDEFRQHLYGASAQSWADACQKTGTTAAKLARAFRGTKP